MNAHHPQPHETPQMPLHLDAWHQHPAAEGMPREEHAAHANVPALVVTFAFITVATAIFSIMIGVYTIGRVNSLKGAGEQAGLEALNEQAKGYQSSVLAAQQTYGWTAEGTVRLPIEQAMERVVEHYQEPAN